MLFSFDHYQDQNPGHVSLPNDEEVGGICYLD